MLPKRSPVFLEKTLDVNAMQDLIAIDSRNLTARIVLVTALLAALFFGWLTVRWQLGDMLADLTPPTDPNAPDIADMALNWSPSDPMASSLKASSTNDTATAIQMFEQAVRLAPYDYLRRIEIGRAYEQDGQMLRAEDEFKKSVELAPEYAPTHWHLGNFYFRHERNYEAMAELKKAAENNQTYRDQVFSLAWDYFNKDAAQVQTLAGDRPDAVAHLAYFFAARGRAEEALRNWNRLSDNDKARHRDTLRVLALGLYDQRHFLEALQFSKQYGSDADAKPEAVTNASFEKNLEGDQDSRFGWLLNKSDPKFEAVPDLKVKHSGTRSLRVGFKSFVKPTLVNIIQTVIVEPNKKYRVRVWVRTENLKSAGGPLLEIVNANDDQFIVRSQAFPTGTNDWQEIAVEFTTPQNCNGISIRTGRAYCGEECPISGTFWYDDFEISRQ